MKNTSGLLMVGGAALVLLFVVQKSTKPAGSASTSGQPAVGNGAASFWSNVVNNFGGKPAATTSQTSSGIGQLLPGGVTLFGNGTFDAGNIYTDPGQLTVNNNTGQVQESPFSGMYGILAPATYGF